MLKLIDGAAQERLGLPLSALFELERSMFFELKAERLPLPRLLQEIAYGVPPVLCSLDTRLGEESAAERQIAEAIRSGADGPPPGLPEELVPVFERLRDRRERGAPLVDVVIDGTPARPGTGSAMATEMLQSVVGQRTALRQHIDNVELFRRWLEPQLSATACAALAEIEKAVTPVWDRGSLRESPFGWVAPLGSAEQASRSLTIARTALAAADGVDLLCALHLSSVSFPETLLSKLARVLPAAERAQLLETLALALDAALDQQPQPSLLRVAVLADALARLHCALPANERGELHDRAGVLLADALGVALQGMAEAAPLAEAAAATSLDEALVRLSTPQAMDTLTDIRHRASGSNDDRLLAVVRIADAIRSFGSASVDLRPLAEHPLSNPVLVSEFFMGPKGTRRIDPVALESAAPPPDLSPFRFGARADAPELKTSIYVQGAGAKGLVSPEVYRQFTEALAKSQGTTAVLDEVGGTSSGALLAALLACGHGPRIGAVLDARSFTSYFSGFAELSGPVDPGVPSTQRTGAFLLRDMYQDVLALLQEGLGVHGRPVLFKDLPIELKVVSTVVASNAPRELLDRLGVGPDGQIVFSRETTPLADVAGAVSCSASVPPFQLERLAVWDDRTQKQYWLQLIDGAMVDNFGAGLVGRAGEELALLTVPNLHQDVGLLEFGVGDERRRELATLNRDGNDELYRALPGFVDALRESGVERAAFIFDILEARQAGLRPNALLGRSAEQTRALHQLAARVGFPAADEAASRRLVVRSYHPYLGVGMNPLETLLQLGLGDAINRVFGAGTFEAQLVAREQRRFHPVPREIANVGELALAFLGPLLAASGQIAHKVVEKEP